MSACSQAVWTRDEPLLVSNYEYSPKLSEAVLLHTPWNGRQVTAMSECLWGALDGMNESGLAVSLALGVRKIVGDGFGIPLILRYILQCCETTAEATEMLCRVPIHMAHNVTVLDSSGEYSTVFVSPFLEPTLYQTKHHQGSIALPLPAVGSCEPSHVEVYGWIAVAGRPPNLGLTGLTVTGWHPKLSEHLFSLLMARHVPNASNWRPANRRETTTGQRANRRAIANVAGARHAERLVPLAWLWFPSRIRIPGLEFRP